MAMSALVCSPFSALKRGSAWLKPLLLLGTVPSPVGSPVHQCLLINVNKTMLKNGVAVYWHGQLWISAQTCALALFYVLL